jgi:long-chain fatty acid transport protein
VTSASGVQYNWPELARAANSEYQGITLAMGGGHALDEKWTIGAALNVNIARLSFSNPGFGEATLPPAFASPAQTIGVGFALSAMFQPNAVSRYGLSYVSKYNLPAATYSAPDGTYKAHFDFPEQFAASAWFAPAEKWELSGEVRVIRYAQTLKSFFITLPGGARVDLAPGWKDQTVFALGAKYHASDKLTLMAGANLCNNPVPAERTSANFLFPGIQKQTFSLGASYRASERIEVGAAWVYSPKAEITDGVMTISNTLNTLAFGLNLRY